MIAPVDSWTAQFAARKQTARSPEARWLDELRETAFTMFATLRFPTAGDEEWKHTNVKPIATTAFEPARHAAADANALPAFAQSHRFVFVNGHLQRPFPLLAGGFVGGLLNGEAPGSAREVASRAWSQHLAKYAPFEADAFVALNTAFLDEAFCLEIAPGAVIEEPIHLVHLTLADGPPAVSHPRTLIVVGARAKGTLVETYLGSGAYLSNSVTEISVGAGASVDHYKVQMESPSAFHVSTLAADLAPEASYSSSSVSLGGSLVRNNSSARLAEGANATLNGLYLAAGAQHVDNHLVVDHAEPNASSQEFYRGILDDRATAAFNGRIVVRRNAQHTDARQSNKNLMLSDDAVVNAKPELRILADDVRCTHGATVGRLDGEAAFYLRSRGIGTEEARSMLTVAFAGEVIDRIEVASLRSALERAVLEKVA